jgi:predicted secreted protein
LAERPTTGFKWKALPVDDPVVTLQDSRFMINSGSGIGGGGVRVFVFKAQSPGTTTIRLQLERPWEKNNAIKRFEVILHVE